jgi:ribonuclease VapC
MVIDTSALLAILQDEPERRRFNEAIESAGTRRMSVASWVESSMVIETRFGAEGLAGLDLRRPGWDRAVTGGQSKRLLPAGLSTVRKSRHSRTSAVFLCRTPRSRRALLYKGEDFSNTDVTSFRPPQLTPARGLANKTDLPS